MTGELLYRQSVAAADEGFKAAINLKRDGQRNLIHAQWCQSRYKRAAVKLACVRRNATTSTGLIDW